MINSHNYKNNQTRHKYNYLKQMENICNYFPYLLFITHTQFMKQSIKFQDVFPSTEALSIIELLNFYISYILNIYKLILK